MDEADVQQIFSRMYPFEAPAWRAQWVESMEEG
jgi:hypothetical protein